MVDRRTRIVVGVDGSPNSLVAVNWAVTEACLRDGVVVLCHVVPAHRAIREDDLRSSAADEVLADAVRHANRRASTVEVTTELAVGSPAHQLLDLASGAPLLVVGARGTGGFAGLRLGSVSAQVTRHARGTVVVVPGLSDRAGDRAERRIVVGVDGSAGCGAALDFAFAEAARRQASVCAIHAFDAATMQLMANLPQTDVLRWHANAADTLRRVVTARAEHHPDVEFWCEVLSGAPASTLTAAAANAELLVLGSRGHGDVATLMLGSTSHTALYNATCPVAVVRDNRPRAGHHRRDHRSPARSQS
jgi:nucleotide-binding universal stress UspA family protein